MAGEGLWRGGVRGGLVESGGGRDRGGAAPPMEQFLDYAITTGQPDKANSALAFRRGHLADFAPMRRCTLPKWIPLFDLACALGRETFPDVWNASEDFRLFLTEREVESVATALRSGAVPTRGVVCTRRIERGTGPVGPQRIE